MPSRSLMVSVSASASTVKDSASHGLVSPVSALRRPRASTAGLKLKRLEVVLDRAGNMLLLSIASTVSMPPYWGVASSASAAGRTDRSISTERNSAVSFLSFMGLPPSMCRSIFSAFRRLWNGQPLGRLRMLGTSPCTVVTSRFSSISGSATGMADSSACV